MDEQPKPFVAPCRELPPKAPIEWLKSGWRDLRAAQGVSLAWGGFCWFLSTVVTWLAWKTGGWVLLISLLSGFIFVAPLQAFGMYSVSRQLCLGRRATLAWTLRAAWRPLSNSLVFALVLLVVLLLWARAGAMVHIFFPSDGEVKLRELATFLIVGSAVGSVFAAINTFALKEEDIEFLYNHLLELETPLTSQELVSALVEERIGRQKQQIEKQRTSGGDLYQPKNSFSINQKLIFPAFDWTHGEVTNSTRRNS